MPRQSRRPNRRTRTTPPGTLRPASAGHHRLEVLHEDHPAERDRSAGRDPVAPTDHERRVLAQPASHDGVLATGAAQHRAWFGQGRGAEQRVETGDDPDPDEERRTGELGRHVARCPENPDQDGVADEHGDPEGDAEDLVQLAAADGGQRGGLGAACHTRGVGQLGIRRGDDE